MSTQSPISPQANPSFSPKDEPPTTLRVGLLGARGHVGRELLRLIQVHPMLSLDFATSSSQVGEPIQSVAPEFDGTLSFIETSPGAIIDHEADLYILALPNDESRLFTQAIETTRGEAALVVDLSADHRFDDGWVYGLSELNAERLRFARRIANPGCYATSMMLGLAPLISRLEGTPHVFGVSGYSGAGSTPSNRNDPERLRDNLMPYQLSGHLHEREVSRHLGQAIRFAPHVAPFFRGITTTILARLKRPMEPIELTQLYKHFYADHHLVEVRPDDIPFVRDATNSPQATIGGLTIDENNPCHVSL
ncbi:MAG: Asd/ArgC dimerization domain-containing protein, partial [Planctomycetota bacterium]|nr:Asd/ArgC dimerization domain-containing protein [Planctomycetota bacterium]